MKMRSRTERKIGFPQRKLQLNDNCVKTKRQQTKHEQNLAICVCAPAPSIFRTAPLAAGFPLPPTHAESVDGLRDFPAVYFGCLWAGMFVGRSGANRGRHDIIICQFLCRLAGAC